MFTVFSLSSMISLILSMSNHDLLLKLLKKIEFGDIKCMLSNKDVNISKVNKSSQGTSLLDDATTAELCKELVMHGANVNAKDSEGRTPLHYAIIFRRGVKVIKELLKCGACVNVRDHFKCTPLIIAVQLLGRDVLEIVRTLLEFGADPNVHDHQGYSLLTLAIYKEDPDLIRELLEWDADINIRNKTPINCFLTYATPIIESINAGKSCCQLLIKMTVMKHFDNNYKRIIDFDRFSSLENFIELSSFIEECACEVLRMKSFMINNRYSLFDYVAYSRKCFKPMYANEYNISEILSAYPIYHNIIATNIKPHLARAELLTKLRTLPFCIGTCINKNDNSCTGELYRDVYLNTDCSFKIAEYLNNDDLSALIKAYL